MMCRASRKHTPARRSRSPGRAADSRQQRALRHSAFGSGQSTLEYAVLIAVVVGALIAMQIYLKQRVQGKLRSSADELGEPFSPTAYKAKFQTVQKSATEETLHVKAQGSGESVSQTKSEDGIDHITNTRTSTEVETLTDRQDADKLFQ